MRTKTFSKDTYQSDWSSRRSGRNHCMCLGAYALYKARQNRGDIPKTSGELQCSAIMEDSLSPEYISNWRTWNGHELDHQVRNGIDSLYDECLYQSHDRSERDYLTKLYKNIRNYYP